MESVEIDYTAKTATVTTKGDVSAEAMIAALEDADYGGSVEN